MSLMSATLPCAWSNLNLNSESNLNLSFVRTSDSARVVDGTFPERCPVCNETANASAGRHSRSCKVLQVLCRNLCLDLQIACNIMTP
jgi:hypothetical protein